MTNYISNINNTPIGGKIVDGQWEHINITIAEGLSVAADGTVDWDLTNNVKDNNNNPYIPNNGYNYAVMVRIRAFTAASGTSRVGAHIYGSPNLPNANFVRFGRVTGVGGSAARTGGTHIVTIKSTDRVLRLLNSDAANNGTFTIELLGRRRLGTNG